MRPNNQFLTLAVMVVGGLAQPSAIAGDRAHGIAWDSAALQITVFQGTSKSISVHFTPDQSIEDATLFVVPELAPFLAFAPALPRHLDPGISYETWALADVATSTLPGTYEGTVHIRSGPRTIPATLKVSLRVVPPSASQLPIEPSSPSSDRITVDVSGQSVVVDELLVAVDPSVADPAQRIAEVAQATQAVIIGASPSLSLYQLRFSSPDLPRLAELRREVIALPGITAASRNYAGKPALSSPPTDDAKYEGTVWNENAPSGLKWNLEAIKARQAWAFRAPQSTPDPILAVIDFGFFGEHEDLRGKVSHAFSTPVDAHGTHVAGTACAEGHNGVGIAGVAWQHCDLRLVPIPPSPPEWRQGAYTRWLADVVHRMDYEVFAPDLMTRAGAQAAIVNMSLGFANPNDYSVTPSAEKVTEINRIFAVPIEKARAAGVEILWVVAAGNERGRDAARQSPASLSLPEWFPGNVVTVASVQRLDDDLEPPWTPGRSLSSNTGAAVTVGAPGEDIYSTVPRIPAGRDDPQPWGNGRHCPTSFAAPADEDLPSAAYDCMSGTSMAAPHVAGVAALVAAMRPAFKAAQIKQCLQEAASVPVRTPEFSGEEPFKFLNAAVAVDCARECEARTTIVSANQWWQDSGVAIAAGDSVTFAAAGTWGDSAGSVGPDGRNSQIVTGPCAGIPQEDCFPLSGYPIDLLVARIGGTGWPFSVGSGATVTAAQNGSLQFVINDRRDILWDNFGALSVNIRVCH